MRFRIEVELGMAKSAWLSRCTNRQIIDALTSITGATESEVRAQLNRMSRSEVEALVLMPEVFEAIWPKAPLERE